jgi:hypothetical protein
LPDRRGKRGGYGKDRALRNASEMKRAIMSPLPDV